MANDLKLQVLLNAIDRVSGPLKAINNSSIGAARALKDARDRLKELNTQQKDVSAWRTQRAAAEQTEQALTAAREKVRALSQQFAATGVPTKAMAKDFRTAVREAQRLKEQHQQQSEQLQTLRTKLYSAGISTKNLSTHERQLRAQIDATNASISTQGKRMAALNARQAQAAKLRNNFAKNREMVGVTATAGASAVATGAAAGLPILAMVKNYSSFEDAMAGVAKQVDGARDDNGKLTQTYYDMGAAIKKMGESIPMATTDIAALVEGGARMGIQGKDNLLEFARVAATAATAFEIPADQVGESLARIAQLYKMPIKNVSQLGDAINFLDDNAMSKGADIIEVMQRTAGITASVGMSFKDAAALGSTFLTLGASAEVAGTATNAMIRELAIATQQPKRFQQGLAAVGLEAKALQAGMAKDATGTIQKVLEAVSKLPKADQLGVMTQLFGKEYGDDAAKLAANIGEYRRQLELVNSTKSSGSMQREGDIKSEQLSARWQMSQNRLFNLSSALGETLRPAIIELVDGFNRIVERVNTWATQNPALVASLLKVAAGIVALSAGFGVVALGIAGVLGPFAVVRYGMAMFSVHLTAVQAQLVGTRAAAAGAGTSIGRIGRVWRTLVASRSAGGLLSALPILVNTARIAAATVLPMLGGAISAVGTAIMATPIGWLLAAITGLVAAGLLVYKYWNPIKGFFLGFWQGLVGALQPVLNSFGKLGQSLINLGQVALTLPVLGIAVQLFGSIVRPLFSLIASGVSNLINWFGQLLKPVEDVGGAAQSMGQRFGSVIGGMLNLLLGLPARFAELGAQIIQGLADGIKNSMSVAKQAITNAGDAVIGWFKEKLDIHSPSRVFAELGGFTMAGLAQGLEGAQSGPLGAITEMGKQVISAGKQALGAIAGPLGAIGFPQLPSGAVASSTISIDDRAPISPTSAPAYDSHDNYEVNIYTTPGMDTQAISRAVRAELARIASEKSARQRSKLSDLE